MVNKRIQSVIQTRRISICHGCLLALRLQARAENKPISTQLLTPRTLSQSSSPFSTRVQKRFQSQQSSESHAAKFTPDRDPLTIFSGIQPTGTPHIGNYLGAIRPWVEVQHKFPPDTKIFYSVVDLHSLTASTLPEDRRRFRNETVAALLASGIDPSRSVLFRQSAVPAHSELMWILSSLASVGSLSRMTQWKTKANLDADTSILDVESAPQLKLGLFSYPVLQAADILVHRATHVPVGQDQLQHLEFARECARVFNARFEEGLLSSKNDVLEPATTVSHENKTEVDTTIETISELDAENKPENVSEDGTPVPTEIKTENHTEIDKISSSAFNDSTTPILETNPILIPPETIISPAKSIKSLRSPDLKMSKSPTPNRPFHPRTSIILLTDTLPDIITKINAAVTDSFDGISYDPIARPGLSNLLEILLHTLKAEEFDRMRSRDKTKALNLDKYNIVPDTVEDLAVEFKACSKLAFKAHVADALDRRIKPIRENMAELLGTEAGRRTVHDVLEKGAEKANVNAAITMRMVRKAVGLD